MNDFPDVDTPVEEPQDSGELPAEEPTDTTSELPAEEPADTGGEQPSGEEQPSDDGTQPDEGQAANTGVVDITFATQFMGDDRFGPLVVTPMALKAGRPFSVEWTTANLGDGDSGDFVDVFSITSDADGSEIHREEVPVSPLGPQAQFMQRVEHPGLPEGDYQLIVTVNGTFSVEEQDLSNNQSSWGAKVEAAPAGQDTTAGETSGDDPLPSGDPEPGDEAPFPDDTTSGDPAAEDTTPPVGEDTTPVPDDTAPAEPQPGEDTNPAPIDAPSGETSEGSGNGSAGAAEGQEFRTTMHDVPILAQRSGMVCWATVATMMAAWKEASSLTVEQVMDRAGAMYRDRFEHNRGLRGQQKPDFLRSLGLLSEPPQSYSVAGMRQLLDTYGPLWITTDESPGTDFAVHARIATGMSGDGTVDGTKLQVNDPAGGRQYTETFRTFMRKFEELAAGDIAIDGEFRVQVVHFADRT